MLRLNCFQELRRKIGDVVKTGPCHPRPLPGVECLTLLAHTSPPGHSPSVLEISNNLPSILSSLRDTNLVHLCTRGHLASPRLRQALSSVLGQTAGGQSLQVLHLCSSIVRACIACGLDYACMFVSSQDSRPHGWRPQFVIVHASMLHVFSVLCFSQGILPPHR